MENVGSDMSSYKGFPHGLLWIFPLRGTAIIPKSIENRLVCVDFEHSKTILGIDNIGLSIPSGEGTFKPNWCCKTEQNSSKSFELQVLDRLNPSFKLARVGQIV
jgi:hypothetical protein